MSVRALGGGRHEIGVHIADVTWFAREGGALDREAAARATTVYLADRRLDMLPPLLSADLCSLRAQRDRYCVSVVWVVDEGREWRREKGSTWVGRTVVRSAHSLAYEQAEALLCGRAAEVATREGAAGPDLVATGDPVPAASVTAITSALHVLSAAAAAMRARRAKAGALSLASAEIDFAIEGGGEGDTTTATPTGIHAHTHLSVHEVVSDLMIAANETVARVVAAVHPRAAILRGHEPPAEDGLRNLARVAEAAGLAPPPRATGAHAAGGRDGARDDSSHAVYDAEVRPRMLWQQGMGAARQLTPALSPPPPAPGPLARGGRGRGRRAHHGAAGAAALRRALAAPGALLCTRVRARAGTPFPVGTGTLTTTHSPSRCTARWRTRRQRRGTRRHCAWSPPPPRRGPAGRA